MTSVNVNDLVQQFCKEFAIVQPTPAPAPAPAPAPSPVAVTPAAPAPVRLTMREKLAKVLADEKLYPLSMLWPCKAMKDKWDDTVPLIQSRDITDYKHKMFKITGATEALCDAKFIEALHAKKQFECLKGFDLKRTGS